MIDIQMDGIYLDNGCLVKEAGIQPDDAFGRILRVVPRLRISPDLPYRRLDFPGRTRRLVPQGIRLCGRSLGPPQSV